MEDWTLKQAGAPICTAKAELEAAVKAEAEKQARETYKCSDTVIAKAGTDAVTEFNERLTEVRGKFERECADSGHTFD